MIGLLRTLRSNTRLIKELVLRDLKARYVGSSMGFFWSVIYPILNLVVYTFVFRVILSVRFGDQAGVKEVAIWMLMGIVVWNAFAETLSRATNCLVENANLIQKVVFPAGVLPIYLTLSSIINMAIGLPVVLVGVLYFGYVAPHFADDVPETTEEEVVSADGARTAACNHCDHEQLLICPVDGSAMRILAVPDGPIGEQKPMPDLALGAALIFLPILMALQAIFTMGVGLFLSAFNLLMRDTIHLVGVFIMVWMFGTPIFYPPYLILQPKHEGRYDFILDINPMYWLIDSYREVVLYNHMPNTELMLTFTVTAFVVFFLGATFFESQRERFPDLL